MAPLAGDVNQLKNKLAFYEAQLRIKMKGLSPVHKPQARSQLNKIPHEHGAGAYDSRLPYAQTFAGEGDPSLQDPEVLVLMAAVWELRRQIDRLQAKNGLS